MNIIRIESQELQFGSLILRRDLPLATPFVRSTDPTEEQDTLVDIELELFGNPSRIPGASLGACPNDIHVYFCKSEKEKRKETMVDLTPSLLKFLNDELSTQPEAELRAGFNTGLQQWLQYAQHDPRIDIASERRIADEKVALPPGSWLDRLGNSETGWCGNAHVFNFLYRTINVPRVRLSEVFQIHGMTVPQAPLTSLAFTLGSYPQPDPSSIQHPAGSLSIRVFYRHSNPNDQKMEEILAALEEFDARLEYMGMQTSGLNRVLVRLAGDVADAAEATESHELQLKALKVRIQELKEAVEHIN